MSGPEKINPAEAVAALREQMRSRSGRSEEELAAMFDPDTAAIMVGRVDPKGEWYREELSERWATTIPRRYQRAALDGPQPGQETEYASAQAWAALSPPPNLVIGGPTGTGKTHLAVASVRGRHDAGDRVVFTAVATLLNRLRPGGGAMIEDFYDVGVLVLDDFAMVRPTEWAYEQIEVIVNERWMNERTTVVTTNLTLPELRDHAGDRVVSRLCGGDAVVLELGGEDRRLA